MTRIVGTVPSAIVCSPKNVFPFPRPGEAAMRLNPPAVMADTFGRGDMPLSQPSGVYFAGKTKKTGAEQNAALFQQFPAEFQPVLNTALEKAQALNESQLTAEHVVWAAIHTLDHWAGWQESNPNRRQTRTANDDRDKQAKVLAEALLPNHTELTAPKVAEILRPLGQQLDQHFKAQEDGDSANLFIQPSLKQAMHFALKTQEAGLESAPQALLGKILWQPKPPQAFAHVAQLARELGYASDSSFSSENSSEVTSMNIDSDSSPSSPPSPPKGQKRTRPEDRRGKQAYLPAVKSLEDSVSALMRHSTNMVQQAKNHEFPHTLLRRESEARLLAMLSAGGERTNILLNASSGEGKTFAVRGVAQRIAHNDHIPAALQGAHMLQLHPDILSDAYKPDEAQKVFTQLNKYLTSNPKQHVILFLDEIHMLGDEQRNAMKAAGILEKKNLSFIGATTPDDWRKSALQGDKAFNGRFSTLTLPSFTHAERLSLLANYEQKQARKSQMGIPPELLELALTQAEKLWPENTLRNATDLLSLSVSLAKNAPVELAALKDKLEEKTLWLETLHAQTTLKGRFKRQAKATETEVANLKQQIQVMERTVQAGGAASQASPGSSNPLLQEKHLRQALAILTGKRIGVLTQDELSKVYNAKTVISHSIIGQPEALETVEKGLREIIVRQKTGGVSKRPISSMLLCGPTGVGKTEVAKIIAREFMDNNFLRLDMSAYKSDHEVSRILGAPPGYVGHENGGLIDKIRTNPNSVVVFDEIEKAHPDIFNILLPILEEGELRDNQGEPVSFNNAIVILTSNLNNAAVTQLIRKHRQHNAEQPSASTTIAASASKPSAVAMRHLETQMRELLTAKPEEGRKGFLPEHLGRIDHVIPFNPLTLQHVSDILDIHLREMNEKEPCLKDNNLKVELSPEAKAHLIELTGASALHAQQDHGMNLAHIPLQQGARDVRNTFQRFVNTNVMTELALNPKLAGLENAKLIVHYNPHTEDFELQPVPLNYAEITQGGRAKPASLNLVG